MYNRIVGGGGVLARAAQQRQQLRAQRQARSERAGNGEEQRGNGKRRSHGSDYKDFISVAQQFSAGRWAAYEKSAPATRRHRGRGGISRPVTRPSRPAMFGMNPSVRRDGPL